MSKEAWFKQFERLEAEYPDKSDDELSDMAEEAVIDNLAARADMLIDMEKERGER